MRPNSPVLPLVVVGTMAMPLLSAAPAQAQATRTWVSGTGNDANPCSRTAPCLTWAGAISKTAAGGEIDALDAGGFGTLTITQSITIDGGSDVASTLAAGTNGITVSAGTTDIVVLRNLRFQGLLGNGSGGTPGLSGIVFNSGAQLTVDNCDIAGFSAYGISIAGNGYVAVTDTKITNIGTAGIGVGGSATSAQVDVKNVRISGTTFGVAVGAGNTMVFSHSMSSKATYGVETDPGGSLFVDNSVVSHNSNGVWAGGQVALANSDITYNTTGVAGGAGTFNSYTNNRFFGNGANGNPPTALTPNPSNPSGQQ